MYILEDFCKFIAEKTGLDAGVLYVISLTVVAWAIIKIIKIKNYYKITPKSLLRRKK